MKLEGWPTFTGCDVEGHHGRAWRDGQLMAVRLDSTKAHTSWVDTGIGGEPALVPRAEPALVHVEPVRVPYVEGFPDHRGGDVETCAYVFNGDWVDSRPSIA